MAHICRSCSGRACPLCPGTSDINLFCYRERVVDLDTEIAYGALDFRVAEQVDGPKISRAPIDQGRLRPSQRMRPEQPRIEPDATNPFADQARVLACRHTAITCFGRNGGLAPVSLPLFQGVRVRAVKTQLSLSVMILLLSY